MKKKEIIYAYENYLDLFEETPAGEYEAVIYTSEQLGISLSKVEDAIYS